MHSCMKMRKGCVVLEQRTGSNLLFPDSSEDIKKLITKVVDVLKRLRVANIENEYILQEMIKEQLILEDIAFIKEYKLAPRNRVDFLIMPGVIIEVKRGRKKPNLTSVINQLSRYTSYDDVCAVILVVERNLTIPEEINGKPCVSVGLNKNWGIAL